MLTKIAPPDKGFDTCILYRAAFSNDVEIVIDDSTYILAWFEALKWFKKVCKDPFLAQRIFDYIYNMRCARYFVKELRFQPETYKRRTEYGNRLGSIY